MGDIQILSSVLQWSKEYSFPSASNGIPNKGSFITFEIIPDKCLGNSQYFHCGWCICHHWSQQRSTSQMGTPHGGIEVRAAGRAPPLPSARHTRVIDDNVNPDLHLHEPHWFITTSPQHNAAYRDASKDIAALFYLQQNLSGMWLSKLQNTFFVQRH